MEERGLAVLRVKEIFFSIQSEGPFTGHPAVFVRLAGCNLKCSFCDEYHVAPYATMSDEDIVRRIKFLIGNCAIPPKIVVITGGEPFLQDFLGVVNLIHKVTDFSVHIETNGTINPRLIFPYSRMVIVCSPKKEKIVHPLMHRYIDWYKFVVRHGDEINLENIRKNFIYIQPMDEGDDIKNKANRDWAVSMCMLHNFNLSSQIHKIFKIR